MPLSGSLDIVMRAGRPTLVVRYTEARKLAERILLWLRGGRS